MQLDFCTAGLSLAVSGRISSLRCVEITDAGERAFWRSAGRLPKPHVPLEYHVASAGANPAAWLAGIDVAILDPPRRGLDAALLAFLCRPPAKGTRSMNLIDGTATSAATPAAPAVDQHASEQHTSTVLLQQQEHAEVDADHGATAASKASLQDVPETGSSKRAIRHRRKHQARRQEQQRSPARLAAFKRQAQTLPDTLQQLVYMACGWSSFEHDCQALTRNGQWQLVSAKAFVFFPGTDSLELLAVFERSNSRSVTPAGHVKGDD